MTRAKQVEKRLSENKTGVKKAHKHPPTSSATSSSASGSEPRVHRKHRFRSGTVALREIRRYQKSTDLLIAKAPFRRLVKDVIHSLNNNFRIQQTAMAALQESTEAYLIDLLRGANDNAIHAKRVTVAQKDVRLELIKHGEVAADLISSAVTKKRAGNGAISTPPGGSVKLSKSGKKKKRATGEEKVKKAKKKKSPKKAASSEAVAKPSVGGKMPRNYNPPAAALHDLQTQEEFEEGEEFDDVEDEEVIDEEVDEEVVDEEDDNAADAQ